VAVRPADAAPRDLAAPQVDALEAPRVDVDLEHRPRGRHALDLPAVHLHREDRPLRPLVGVGAQVAFRRLSSARRTSSSARLRTASRARANPRRPRRPPRRGRPGAAGSKRAANARWRAAAAAGVADEHAVHGVRVPVGTDLQQVVAQGAQDLDVAPGEARGEDEAVERVVGRALLVERAQRVHEAPLPLPQRGDPVGGRLDVEAVQVAAPALGQGERDAQLLGDGEPEVLHGLQDVGEVEGAHRDELHGGRLRGLRDDARLEPALERLELAQVARHLLRRGHLAVEAAARLGVT
jgi:hypothetical protein